MPNPVTIRRQAKRFKETGSVKNRKVNRRHVLTEETLDEIGERNLPEITRVSVWEQRQYDTTLAGRQAKATSDSCL